MLTRVRRRDVCGPADEAAKSIMGFFLTMCFLMPVSNLVRGIVSEKETRIREGMKMMVSHALVRCTQCTRISSGSCSPRPRC